MTTSRRTRCKREERHQRTRGDRASIGHALRGASSPAPSAATDNKVEDDDGDGAMDDDVNDNGNGATDDDVDDDDGDPTTDGDRTTDDDVDNDGYGTTDDGIDRHDGRSPLSGRVRRLRDKR